MNRKHLTYDFLNFRINEPPPLCNIIISNVNSFGNSKNRQNLIDKFVHNYGIVNMGKI